MKTPKLGEVVFVRWFVSGYPLGVGTDTRLRVTETSGPKRNPKRFKLERDDERAGAWWVDLETIRQQGEP